MDGGTALSGLTPLQGKCGVPGSLNDTSIAKYLQWCRHAALKKAYSYLAGYPAPKKARPAIAQGPASDQRAGTVWAYGCAVTKGRINGTTALACSQSRLENDPTWLRIALRACAPWQPSCYPV